MILPHRLLALVLSLALAACASVPDRAATVTVGIAAFNAKARESVLFYTREWEEREGRRAITDWQLARYFEII